MHAMISEFTVLWRDGRYQRGNQNPYIDGQKQHNSQRKMDK